MQESVFEHESVSIGILSVWKRLPPHFTGYDVFICQRYNLCIVVWVWIMDMFKRGKMLPWFSYQSLETTEMSQCLVNLSFFPPSLPTPFFPSFISSIFLPFFLQFYRYAWLEEWSIYLLECYSVLFLTFSVTKKWKQNVKTFCASSYVYNLGNLHRSETEDQTVTCL